MAFHSINTFLLQLTISKTNCSSGTQVFDDDITQNIPISAFKIWHLFGYCKFYSRSFNLLHLARIRTYWSWLSKQQTVECHECSVFRDAETESTLLSEHSTYFTLESNNFQIWNNCLKFTEIQGRQLKKKRDIKVIIYYSKLYMDELIPAAL